MGELLTSAWFIWLLVGVFALILELCTSTMVSIWFVPSAVLVSLQSLVCPSTLGQIIMFLLLSAFFLWLFKKKFAAKFNRNKDGDLNPDAKLIGRIATAETDISDVDGKVLVGDVYWRAVCSDDQTIGKGSQVVVTEVSGTTLTVTHK